MAITFDEVLPTLNKILKKHHKTIQHITPIIVNRNIYGKISLILKNGNDDDLSDLKDDLTASLGCYASETPFFDKDDNFFEVSNLKNFYNFDNIYLIERTIYESSWNKFKLAKSEHPIIAIWSEACYTKEKRDLIRNLVLSGILCRKGTQIIDVDFESRQCSYLKSKNGVLEWLIEDMVNNSDTNLDLIDIYYGHKFIRSCNRSLETFHNKLERAFMPRWKDNLRVSWTDAFRDFKYLKNQTTILICESGFGEAAAGMFNNIATHAIVYDKYSYLKFSNNLFSRNGALFVRNHDDLVSILKNL
jgi:hypothetical protein